MDWRILSLNYRQIISRLLDCLGANNSCTGYDYIIYGLLLVMDDVKRINLIVADFMSCHQTALMSCL